MDEDAFVVQGIGMRTSEWVWPFAIFLLSMASGVASTPDPAGQLAAGIVAGVEAQSGGRLGLNEKTGRLEVRDEAGSLIEEISSGTAGKAVDVGGQEYRLSYGKDDMGRRAVLVRAGPAMQKPITIDILGRKSVLSIEASLLVTIDEKNRVLTRI